ncbi:hypothetical protein [Leptolyngbya sp. GGD]|uniref:hypothetical protein n=1 Tax=Leptolyngbya sp. GGD TaxID=2997907 RepID=UPI00227CEE10|nr:hypothetical protein [Leptolyngbya sp. GGD]MCY6494393.1 hypothetical protein [Leptolyngbya sp. GGD]
MSSEHNSKAAARKKAIKVSMPVIVSTLVFFILMVTSWFLFNPTLINTLMNLRGKPVEEDMKTKLSEEVKQQIREEARKQVTQARTKILADQKAILQLDKTSPLGRTYISEEISKQAREQSEKVAKDEINQAKGDLFGQVAFPVIFAIASIFAAFAVKDILTEVLKQQERDRIRQDLEKELTDYIVPRSIRANQRDLSHRLVEITSHIHLLEYELINIKLNHLVAELEDAEGAPTIETLRVVGELSNRSNKALLNIRTISEEGLAILRVANHKILELKVRGLGGDLVKLERDGEQDLENETQYTLNLFQAQINLLATTLTKAKEGLEKSEQHKIDSLIRDLGKFLSRNLLEEMERSAYETRTEQTRITPGELPPMKE